MLPIQRCPQEFFRHCGVHTVLGQPRSNGLGHTQTKPNRGHNQDDITLVFFVGGFLLKLHSFPTVTVRGASPKQYDNMSIYGCVCFNCLLYIYILMLVLVYSCTIHLNLEHIHTSCCRLYTHMPPPKKNLLSIISLCFLLIQVPIRSKHFPPANLQGFGPIIVELPREEHRHASSWFNETAHGRWDFGSLPIQHLQESGLNQGHRNYHHWSLGTTLLPPS